MLAGLALVTVGLWGCAQARTTQQEPRGPGITSVDPAPYTTPNQTGGVEFGTPPSPGKVYTPRVAEGQGRRDPFEKSILIDPKLPPPPAPVWSEEELLVIAKEMPKTSAGISGEFEPPLNKLQVRETLARGGSLATCVRDRVVPLPLEHTDVRAQLTFMIGSVTVTQQYHNPYGGKIEAVYVFPLPDDAAVRDFILQVGERRIRGIIRDREEATQIYLDARRQGHVASLMTQERPNIFTQRVANIEPGKRIDVSITYFHTLRYQEGEFTFVYPMVVGPRYNPAGTSDGVGAVTAGAYGASREKTEVQYLPPGEIAANDISFQVDINAGAPIGEVTSPTHAIRAARTVDGGLTVTLSPNDRIPNRDFVLRYRLEMVGARAAMAVQPDESGGTFALVIHPPGSLQSVPRTAREMIFVIDCSGSMNGRPVEVAKRALVKCLRRLEADDTFQILRFSDRVNAFEAGPVAATPENVRRGVAFAEALFTDGGTEMQEVVRIALDYPVAPGRRRIVSFMTDGYIGNDREVVAFARDHLGGARIFSFGVGSSVNRYLLEALARVGRGVSTFITLDESSEIAAEELYKRVEHPALTDLKIDWGGASVVDVQPYPLPDLYLGRPIVLLGHYKGARPTKVMVTGRAGDRLFEVPTAAGEDGGVARHPALPAVWARTRIASLQDALFVAGDSREISGEIRTLALRYGLLSEYTAFVAVDSLTRTAGEFGTTVVQPVSVPDGVQYSTTVEKK
jgi:Ca-activated chloride channel family protein